MITSQMPKELSPDSKISEIDLGMQNSYLQPKEQSLEDSIHQEHSQHRFCKPTIFLCSFIFFSLLAFAVGVGLSQKEEQPASVKLLPSEPKAQISYVPSDNSLFWEKVTFEELTILIAVQHLIDKVNINNISILTVLEPSAQNHFQKLEVSDNKQLTIQRYKQYDLSEGNYSIMQTFFDELHYKDMLVINNTLEYLSDADLDSFFNKIIPMFKYSLIISYVTDQWPRLAYYKGKNRAINIEKEIFLEKQVLTETKTSENDIRRAYVFPQMLK